MRGILLRLVVLCTLLVLVAAWSKEDHEIFRLRDEVEASEGPDTTFYDFLGIPSSASHEDIVKAQRKKSRTLHPDKVKQGFVADRSTATGRRKASGKKAKPSVHVSKGPSQREIQTAVKKATERYQRLTVVANILKGEGRERYDHFLKHGFPAWRGTGYYYKRFRPGLGTVIFGLFVVGGGAAHYGVLVLSWNRQREFVGRYIRQARKAAWGDESGIRGIPGIDATPAAVAPPAEEADTSGMQLNRRQKRQMEKEQRKEKAGKGPKRAVGAEAPPLPPPAPTGDRKRVVAENGKVLSVDSIGNVFLEEEDEEGNVSEFLLDPNEIARPTIRDTAVYQMPMWIYHQVMSRFQKKPQEIAPDTELLVTAEDEPEEEQDSGSSFEVVDNKGTEQVPNGPARKRNKKGNR